VARPIRARFSKGKIEPLERIRLREGEEISIVITGKVNEAGAKEKLARVAGAWKDTLDFDAFLRDLYASRREPSRDLRL